MRENRTPSEEKVWLKYYTEEQRNRITPKRTMYEHLYLSNVDHMNIHAIEYYGKSITFATLFQKIEDCAKALAYQGVKKGDIVAVCMPNLPEAVISVYAINKLGAIANMIHPLKSQNEIEAYILETKTKVVIALDSVVPMLSGLDVTVISCSPKVSMSSIVRIVYAMKQAGKRKEGVVFVRDAKAHVVDWEEFIRLGRDTVYEERKCDAMDIAIMLHTGGTSGNEKTVALSNNNFNAMITQLKVVADNFSVGEKMLTIMPVFHGLGLCSSIHLPLCYGVGVILVPKFEKKEFAGLMKKKPNHIIGVPTLFNAMMNDKKINKMDLSHLKYVVYGGDAMKNEDAFNEFLSNHNASIDVQKGYGLSEAVAGVTFAFGACNKAESIGIPMININVKIVDIHTKEELDYNQVGEICISGPTVMDGGYYNKPQETVNVLEEDEKGVVWLHTGDMGYMDSDGVMFYSQRVDRMFQSSGVNVYPEGIEKVLLKAERVSSCVVVSQKHDYKGKVPVAFVVLENKETTISDDLSKELEQLCKQNLDRYHQPSRIIAIREIPETKLGKRDYRALEKKAEGEIQ